MISTQLENHVTRIVQTTPCRPHNREAGTPCHFIFPIDGGVLQAICNSRARSAGMTHKISKDALAKKR